MELIELKVMGHRCTRCLYEWVPRDVDRPPRICPKCKSAYWDRPRRTFVVNPLSGDPTDNRMENLAVVRQEE